MKTRNATFFKPINFVSPFKTLERHAVVDFYSGRVLWLSDTYAEADSFARVMADTLGTSTEVFTMALAYV